MRQSSGVESIEYSLTPEGARVPSLVREPDHTCHNYEFACLKKKASYKSNKSSESATNKRNGRPRKDTS